MAHASHNIAQAFATSPDGRRVIVAGRDYLRLATLSSDPPSASLDDAQNLLANTRRHMNLSSNDVQWRPRHPSQVATGANNGDVILWDTEKKGDALFRTIKAPSSARAVNRLSFNPEEPQQLLVASHERTVRMWDVDQRSQQFTFATNAEVRDVQWSPHNRHAFAAGLENGMTQIFDVRQAKRHLALFQAHQGPVYAVEWHPEERGVLATGGRDRAIKVWELETALGSGGPSASSVGSAAGGGGITGGRSWQDWIAAPAAPSSSSSSVAPQQQQQQTPIGSHTYAVLTLGAVARLKWRPGTGTEQRWHIASCAGTYDVQPHVWDVRRPSNALYSLRGHREMCCGITFLGPPIATPSSGHILLSISKEPRLLFHPLSQLEPPYARMPPVALCWSPHDDILCANNPTIVALREHHAAAAIPGAPAAAAAAAEAEQRAAADRVAQAGGKKIGGIRPAGEKGRSADSLPSVSAPSSPKMRPAAGGTVPASPKALPTAGAQPPMSPSMQPIPPPPPPPAPAPHTPPRYFSTSTTSLPQLPPLNASESSESAGAGGGGGTSSNMEAAPPSPPPLYSGACARFDAQTIHSAMASSMAMPDASELAELAAIFQPPAEQTDGSGGGGGEGAAAASEADAAGVRRSSAGERTPSQHPSRTPSMPTTPLMLPSSIVSSTTSLPQLPPAVQQSSASASHPLLPPSLLGAATVGAATAPTLPSDARLNMLTCPSPLPPAHSPKLTHSQPQLPATTTTTDLLPLSMASVLEEAEGEEEAMAFAMAQAMSAMGGAAVSGDGRQEDGDGSSRLLSASERVKVMAMGYRVTGASVGELCAHNAMVATQAGEVQLASTWQALDFILRELGEADENDALNAGSARVGVALEEAEEAPPLLPPSIDSPSPIPPLDEAAEAAAAATAAATATNGVSPLLTTNGLGMSADDSREALLSVILPVVESLLEHHAERGDAQTCAVLARTLRPVSEKLAPKGRIRKWTLGYVEQLHRLQLFGLANAVIKQSDDERVQQLNQRSTTVTVGGGGASSSQNKPARARCSVCQLPVRGLHSWNQGCGHGGHAECMRAWFAAGNLECPTGCGHICCLRPPPASLESKVSCVPCR